MRFVSITIGLAALLLASPSAWSQLKPFHDYDTSEEITHVTTVKVNANMIDDYLEGIRKTWAAAADTRKTLGHLKDYSIFVSELPNSGDFNIVLVEHYENRAQSEPSKDRYDAFMKAWGEDTEAKTREISKNYPSMREISGEYSMRQITFKKAAK
jgi:hypothetical protein